MWHQLLQWQRCLHTLHWKSVQRWQLHRTEIVVRKLVIQAYDQLKTNIYF